MSWYAVCDKCLVMSGGGGDAGGGRHPDLPEGWIQVRSGRLYCTKPSCAEAGQRALRRQKPSPAERAERAPLKIAEIGD